MGEHVLADCGDQPRAVALGVPLAQPGEVFAGLVDHCPGQRRPFDHPGPLRHRMASEVHAEHPERIRRAVPKARQRPRFDPGAGADARGRHVGRGVDDHLGATVGPGWLDMDDGLPRPWSGQAPAVPAGHDLVQVVGRRVRVPVERGQLQETDVGDVGEDRHVAFAGHRDAALVQAVPVLARVVPHFHPDAANDVVEQ